MTDAGGLDDLTPSPKSIAEELQECARDLVDKRESEAVVLSLLDEWNAEIAVENEVEPLKKKIVRSIYRTELDAARERNNYDLKYQLRGMATFYAEQRLAPEVALEKLREVHDVALENSARYFAMTKRELKEILATAGQDVKGKREARFGNEIRGPHTPELQRYDTVDFEVGRELNRRRARAEADRILAEEARAANPPAELDVATADEILSRGEEPKPRIEGVLPAGGRGLLMGQAKGGKSTILGNIARSLLTGEPFLGRFAVEPLAEGRTFFLMNMENTARTQAEWVADQVPAEHLHRLPILSSRGRDNLFHDPDRLIALLRERNVGVWAIDPLNQAFTGDNSNDNDQATSFLRLVDRVAREAGVDEIILVAHIGHNSESGHARGASALMGWGESNVLLSQNGTDADSPRYFQAQGRDVNIPKARLDFDPSTRLLIYTGESAGSVRLSKKVDELSDPILEIVRKTPGIASTTLKDSLRRTGLPFQDRDVNAARAELERAGRLVARKEGRRVHNWLPADVPPKYQLTEIDPDSASETPTKGKDK